MAAYFDSDSKDGDLLATQTTITTLDVIREETKDDDIYNIGSRCWVYSNSQKKWMFGQVISTNNLQCGKALTIRYNSGDNFKQKQLLIGNKDLKPFDENTDWNSVPVYCICGTSMKLSAVSDCYSNNININSTLSDKTNTNPSNVPTSNTKSTSTKSNSPIPVNPFSVTSSNSQESHVPPSSNTKTSNSTSTTGQVRDRDDEKQSIERPKTSTSLKSEPLKSTVSCDICGKTLNSNENCYHCPNGKMPVHDHGYDLCQKCGLKQNDLLVEDINDASLTISNINNDIDDEKKGMGALQLGTKPFAKGGTRYAYLGRYELGSKKGKGCVIKKYMDKHVMAGEEYSGDLKCCELANELVIKWNEMNIVNKKYEMVMPTLARKDTTGWELLLINMLFDRKDEVKSMLKEMEKSHEIMDEVGFGEVVIIEDYLPGTFVKWNSNSGWHKTFDVSVQAFCHWTYHYSKGEYLFCDAQGIRTPTKYILTDPCILSNTPKGGQYGVADVGREYLLNWFLNHKCNEYCNENWLIPSFNDLQKVPVKIKTQTSQNTIYRRRTTDPISSIPQPQSNSVVNTNKSANPVTANLKIGSRIDASDSRDEGHWYKATVIDIKPPGEPLTKDKSKYMTTSSQIKLDKLILLKGIYVSYDNWDARWNEWIYIKDDSVYCDCKSKCKVFYLGGHVGEQIRFKHRIAKINTQSSQEWLDQSKNHPNSNTSIGIDEDTKHNDNNINDIDSTSLTLRTLVNDPNHKNTRNQQNKHLPRSPELTESDLGKTVTEQTLILNQQNRKSQQHLASNSNSTTDDDEGLLGQTIVHGKTVSNVSGRTDATQKQPLGTSGTYESRRKRLGRSNTAFGENTTHFGDSARAGASSHLGQTIVLNRNGNDSVSIVNNKFNVRNTGLSLNEKNLSEKYSKLLYQDSGEYVIKCGAVDRIFWNRYAPRILMVTNHSRIILVKESDVTCESIRREDIEKVEVINYEKFRVILKNNTISFRTPSNGRKPREWKDIIDEKFKLSARRR